MPNQFKHQTAQMPKTASKTQLAFTIYTYTEEDDRGKGEALSQVTYHVNKE